MNMKGNTSVFAMGFLFLLLVGLGFLFFVPYNPPVIVEPIENDTSPVDNESVIVDDNETTTIVYTQLLDSLSVEYVSGEDYEGVLGSMPVEVEVSSVPNTTI
jgi:hypothetical protein